MFTVKSIQAAGPGRHRDDKGLYLEVSKDGATKRWLYRFTSPVTFKVTEAGLGVFPTIGLADARAKATDMRAAIAKGVDPIIAKRETRAAAIAMQKAAMTLSDALAAYQQAFKNKGATTADLVALLKRHAGLLLSQPMAAISTTDVLKVLQPLQALLPKTAAKVRAAISTIFDYAIARDMFVGTNPASRSVFRFLLPPPPTGEHHRAMDYRDIQNFWQRLSKSQSVRSQALRLLILTGLRTSECLYLSWDECDLNQRLITIPAHRMKMRRPHAVPITDAMLSVLMEARARFGHKVYVFPSPHGGRLARRALENLLHKQLMVPVSAHGFRSTLRDWLGDCTNVDRDTAEQILAHAIPGVEGAYRRSTGLDKRRQALTLWADYVTGRQVSNVVSFASVARP
jgi:integrase